MTVDKESAFVQAIADMREDEAMELVRSLIAEGVPAQTLLDLSRKAMDLIGSRFERCEYFLPELVLAGEMLQQIGALLKPLLAQSVSAHDAARPTVLIGTVQGDLHDIGKNIVTFMLEVNGFRVIDLGVDVPVGTFVEKVREHQPAVIGLSGFLTLAFDAMRDTIQALAASGLREGRKIMIGGGQVDEAIRSYTGADAYGPNAMAAVSLCHGWLGNSA